GGPRLRFASRTLICVTGAATASTVDGMAVRVGVPTEVAAGQVLDLGPLRGPGLRGYLAVRGGLDVPTVLGSRSTFLLGGFGGLAGRALRAGDVLAALTPGAGARRGPLLTDYASGATAGSTS